jgi:histidinol-phosphate/aromatic aminotransferase/cobyric acid decarboxylase-like protein
LLASQLAHPDFLLWAMSEGAQLAWIVTEHDEKELCAAIERVAPQVLYLERPSATGNIVGLDTLARICKRARRHGSMVIVDEAYLAYFAGAGSAVAVLPTVDNLIVIRSLSKAYCSGGLRVGFAMAGAIAAGSLRRLIAPLQVSELAFQMALSLLKSGDIFVRLRERIAAAKSEMILVLKRAGISVLAGNPELPWILIDDASGQKGAMLAARGISGKRLVPFNPTMGVGFLRLAVPLSDERQMKFCRAMSDTS